MLDITELTDADLAAAALEQAKRNAAVEQALRDEKLLAVQPLTEAGIGSTNSATVAELLTAIDDSLPTLPRELYAHANAALIGLGSLHELLTTMAQPVQPIVLPTPAVA